MMSGRIADLVKMASRAIGHRFIPGISKTMRSAGGGIGASERCGCGGVGSGVAIHSLS